jgi:hypothetical protein
MNEIAINLHDAIEGRHIPTLQRWRLEQHPVHDNEFDVGGFFPGSNCMSMDGTGKHGPAYSTGLYGWSDI